MKKKNNALEIIHIAKTITIRLDIINKLFSPPPNHFL